MSFLNQPGGSLALLTDLYELTMAYGYWKSGTSRKEAVFNLIFRRNPFRGGYAVACGLEAVIDFMRDFRFTEDDLAYLATLTGSDSRPLFERAFLDYLGDLRLSCDVDAIPEGTVVFPNEPLVRVTGPIMEAQLLETALLTFINFQTLIATKAARICHATDGEPVLEYGLRRAQGINGGLTASRAAYIGGCAGTSNVLAGKIYGIPVRGTHAHSWVMSFDTELESFRTYAEAMPNNCIFLVDTYDTLEGVRHAIEIGQWLRSHGRDLAGIRLDSGDLAYLSIEARKLLDQAGFKKAVIVGSNDLDESIIRSLKDQGATITVWGVGTRLVTAFDQPALGGVYKLAAIREPGQPWNYKVKLSEQAIKISNPGIQQVRRYEKDGLFVGDVIHDVQQPDPQEPIAVDPLDPTRRKPMPQDASWSDLLVPVFRHGSQVCDLPSLHDIRNRTAHQLAQLHAGTKRFLNPHEYPVGLEPRLHDLRTILIRRARGLPDVQSTSVEESESARDAGKL